MDRIPGLHLRASDTAENNGIDYDQFNEFTHDYIEFQRDLYSIPPKPANNLVTFPTVNNLDTVSQQTEIKMIKIKSKPISNNAWGLTDVQE